MSFIATMYTGSYDWLATGDTEKLAIKAMLSGWHKHKRDCKKNAPELFSMTDWLTDNEVTDEINITRLVTFNTATGKHLKPACWIDGSLYWEGKL